MGTTLQWQGAVRMTGAVAVTEAVGVTVPGFWGPGP